MWFNYQKYAPRSFEAYPLLPYFVYLCIYLAMYLKGQLAGSPSSKSLGNLIKIQILSLIKTQIIFSDSDSLEGELVKIQKSVF